jgi:hypothetical protein
LSNTFGTSLSAVGLVASLFALSACNSVANKGGSNINASDLTVSETTPIKSLIPADRLAKIKAALPQVQFENVSTIFKSDETLWYDHDVMTPTYQDSVGVNSNADWPRLVAKTADTNPAIAGLFDAKNKRWQFPFSVTAGTDRSENIKVVNFLHLPHVNGKPLSVPIWTVNKNANRPNWNWVYPIGTTFGEIIFIENSGELLATEVRIRKRYKSGWATNSYRPFPTARHLSDAIKERRSNWRNEAKLSRMIDHLEDNGSLKSEITTGKAELAKSFRQESGVDQLPNFEDPTLVKELLTKTVFVSAYGKIWKDGGAVKSYAPTTQESVSIVPSNFQGHFLEISDDSCTRCHKDSGKKVSEYYSGLYLYGEVWGKDGIFSFHPFDESEFSKIRQSGNGPDNYYDNRKINPKLAEMGVFERYDAAKHGTDLYPPRGE